MAISANSHTRISLKELFSVLARLISRQLIGTDPVEIHGFYVRMALAAHLDDLFFVRYSDVTCAGRLGEFLCCFCRVAAVTTVAENTLLGVNAALHILVNIRVT